MSDAANSLSEFEYLAMLSNSQARLAVGRYKDELRGELSDVGRLIFDVMMEGAMSEAEVIPRLLSSGLDAASIMEFYKKARIYQVLTPKESRAVIESLDKFVRSALILKYFRRYEDRKDMNQMVEQLRSLTPLTSSCIPFIDPNDRDFDMIVKEGNATVIPSTISFIQNSVFHGYLKGQVIGVGGKPGSGKSTLMLQEAIYMASEGNRVYYITLGDLMEIDIYMRAACLIFDRDQEYVIPNLRKLLDTDEMKEFFKNFRLTVAPAQSLSSFELIEFIKVHLREMFDYDVVVFDYDSNVKVDEEQHMYTAQGELYDLLSSVARPDLDDPSKNKLVLVGSQIKNIYYANEIIPLDGFAESSRKQQIIDMGIMVSSIDNPNGAHIGYISQCKSRRGKIGEPFPYKFTHSGRIKQITEFEYLTLKGKTSS